LEKIIQEDGPIAYWEIQTAPFEPDGMLNRSGVNEGMYKKQVPESRLVNYFTVESISDFLLKIEKLDGKVIKPNQEVIKIGLVATAEDLKGNLFALIQQIRV
jgi:predicted enzyme related to lactoylglutathione lyase